MDDEFNITYITLDGYVELDKYRYIYICIMFIVYILTIFCNVSILYTIWIHNDLHEPMYIFIAGLLVNSVFYSTIMYPKLLADFLSEKRIISYPTCLFQFFIYYSLSASDFLLLSTMAYDRYVSICKPLQYPTIMRKTTVIILLVLAWAAPACHLAAEVILRANMKLCHFNLSGIFCNNSIYSLFCVTSTSLTIYGFVALLNLGLLPFVFIIFTYTRILIITYRSSREVKNKAAQTCLPHIIVLISFCCLCAYDVIIARLESDVPKTVRSIITLQAFLYYPLFNPVIYGLKMKEISKHLKKLFCQAKVI
ncbi:olfactory receptor 140-like [Larimichthys crocea]|uniref:olfactory receptor 140-like n=1 Tax=Larimichthys crocea TaxID=215358 RepID=UPI000F5F90F9|nr:olfactory receptor 140-like [Larimichthys crocea]